MVITITIDVEKNDALFVIKTPTDVNCRRFIDRY